MAGSYTKIEVECRSQDDAMRALSAGADIVMLDNFGPEGVGAVAQEIKAKFPHAIVEVSGGINPSNVEPFVRGGGQHVDIISMGCLTQGVASVDLSMKVDKDS
eukprot:NODE_10765_length_478_cov_35.894587_g10742_i0.p1 GENE.NODE_10765_length_478_cov_35.894587_g10742_i0~~NODE_10765_length_478_cov_35.894587_g10742_i0.p1  ORF type:complete len:119 (+),score=30.30 NODE_10765_length_478_cov_35.894587_g10742_i0:50-358(+)